MTRITLPTLVGVAFGIAAFAVIELVVNPVIWVSLLVGVIVGVVIVTVLLARSRGEAPRDVAREVVTSATEAFSEPRTTVEERTAHEQLLRASTVFVTSGAMPSLVDPLKQIVTTLRTVIPRALEFAPDSETTFNIVKLAREDLPRQMVAFVAMSDSDRKERSKEFATQLDELREKLAKLTRFIDEGRERDFDAESSFINLKFG